MAQILYIKTASGDMRTVQVVRSWLSSGGETVVLHRSGKYAYKDETPLRSVSELDTLPLAQRALALAWWERTGQAESEAYYARLLAQARETAGDYQEDLVRAELDAVTYIRKKKGGVKTLAPSAPHIWQEWFQARPDWWGQAKVIAFADYSYEMVEVQPPAPADAAETK